MFCFAVRVFARTGKTTSTDRIHLAAYRGGSLLRKHDKRFSVRVAGEELEKLLPAGTADLPVEELTPAQRRMVCIVRACITPSDVRLMDEPFAGMTKEEKEKSIAYIRSVLANTPLVITCLPGEELPFGKTFHLS